MYSAMVLRGGGVRGIGYAGALQVIEQKGILKGIQRVAGSSAGAIVAALVALNYNAASIKSIVNQLDFKSLEDNWDIFRIPSHYGLYAGDRALAWLETMISNQAGPKATFADLRARGFKDLYVVATSLNTQSAVIFCADKTPDVIVSEAVRASMSIPFFFKAAQVTGIDDLFVDGGVVWNYPITLFDLKETLGLYLTNFTPAVCPKVSFGQAGQYIKSLFETLLNSQDIMVNADKEVEAATLRIDALGISATDFGLSDQQKQSLFQSGVDCATKFFA